MKNKQILFYLLSLSCLVNSASAQTFAEITADAGNITINAEDPNVGQLALTSRLITNHSYCCEVREELPYQLLLQFSNVKADGLDTVPYTVRGTSAPTRPDDTRVCFLAGATNPDDVSKTAQDHQLLFKPYIKSNIKSFTARCDDTSLVGGVNTFSSDFNFLEIVLKNETQVFRQISEPSILVKVIATNSNGESLFQRFVRMDTSRVDIPLDPLIPANTIAKLNILHDGPVGSIAAWIAEYKIDPSNAKTGFSLLARERLIPVGKE